MKRVTRRLLKVAGVLLAIAAVVALIGVLTLRSPWFHEKVRQRIVYEIERVTGGEATLGDWVFNWELFTVGFTELTLRGTEPADAPPLLHTKNVHVGLKLISLWKRDVDIEALIVDEPRVNIIVNADRSTNIPRPKVSRPSGKARLEPLIDWKIGKIGLRNGTLLFAEKRYDIQLRGENLHTQLAYDFSRPRYQGTLSIQPLFMNAPWMQEAGIGVDMAITLEKNRIEIPKVTFDLRRSVIEASGSIDDLGLRCSRLPPEIRREARAEGLRSIAE